MTNDSANADTDVPRSTGRVLDLLEIVLGHGSCNLTTAATDAGLTPTTGLRHLRALEARGYLMRDEAGEFSAGPTVLRMAASLREQGPLERLVAAAQSHLETLADLAGESTYLSVSDGEQATYVATADSDRSIRHVGWVGQRVTLDGTAVGEAVRKPGVVAVRTGAIEPDITALSLSLGTYAKLAITVSVVGPAHRLTPTTVKSISLALVQCVDDLCETLGIDAQELAS